MNSINTNFQSDNKCHSGSVKWYCDQRGFGFLTGYGLNGDIFAHYSEILTNELFRKLRKGQEVSFTLELVESKKVATNITILV